MRLDVRNTRSLDGSRSWKTTDQFFSTYWGGLDARIYANDVLMDEILVLQYTVQEAVMPLFSYADYTFGSVMHGARRVQGSFTINYKRESYLFELLRTLAHETFVARPTPYNSEAYRIARGGAATLEHFIALAASDGNTEKDESGRIKVDPELLNRVASDFERAIWGQDSLTPADGTSSVNQVVTEALHSTSRSGPRFEVPGRFDLNIHFGSSQRMPFQKTRIVGFNDVQPVDNSQVDVAVQTNLRILDVALTGVEKTVDDSGRPVLENYTFIARDVL
jgi:hypothetical protein